MSNVRILVEGTKDQSFILKILELRFNAKLGKNNSFELPSQRKGEVLKLSGYAYLNDVKGIKLLQENNQNGGLNLVIFDADNNFQQKNATLQQWQAANHFHWFLFPDNLNTGTIENLQVQMLLPNYQPAWNCVANYRQCLVQAGVGTAGLKGQMSILANELGLQNNQYDTILDFNAAALQPLITFLTNYL